METIVFDKDLKVLYVSAKSYPEGIFEAHQELHRLIPFSTQRKYFGISRPENGEIGYKAAAEEMALGEAQKLGCDTLILKRGNYICLTVFEYLKDLSSIDRAFETLLTRSDLDPQGYCVEWYFNDKDVKCMIRLNQ